MADHGSTQTLMYRGRAAEDLATTNNPAGTLKVIVPELTPALTGGFSPGTTTANVTTTNLAGATVTSQVTVANHLVADWFGESNMPFPPVVRQGEQVDVWAFGDGGDKYYWKANGRDRNFRQTDRVRFEVSATPSTVKSGTKDETTTYFVELDSINKQVSIRTSRANGEPVAWAISINTGSGLLAISDDANLSRGMEFANRFLMDSTGQLTWNNCYGCTIQMAGKNIIVDAVEDLILRSGRQTVYQSPSISVIGGNVLTMTAPSMGFSASNSMTFSTPAACFTGSLKVAQMLATAALRFGNSSIGPIGTAFTAPVIDTKDGTFTGGTNTADTQAGATARHPAAAEDVTEMMTAITALFDEVNGKIGVPSGQSQLTNMGKGSAMPNMSGPS